MDWRDQNNWGCNDERNPYGAHYLDGGSLEAMEVMFVKVKQRIIDLDWSYPYAATQYDKWYLALDEVCSAATPHREPPGRSQSGIAGRCRMLQECYRKNPMCLHSPCNTVS